MLFLSRWTMSIPIVWLWNHCPWMMILNPNLFLPLPIVCFSLLLTSIILLIFKSFFKSIFLRHLLLRRRLPTSMGGILALFAQAVIANLSVVIRSLAIPCAVLHFVPAEHGPVLVVLWNHMIPSLVRISNSHIRYVFHYSQLFLF
jgi:hypothetical protein